MVMAEPRQKRINRALGWSVAGSLAGGVVLAVLYEASRRGKLPEGAAILVASLALVGALAACLPWWRRLDDMAREAHGVSWFWGGSLGMGLGLIALMIGAGMESPQFAGAMTVVGLEIAGYGAAWLGWWAWKRRR